MKRKGGKNKMKMIKWFVVILSLGLVVGSLNVYAEEEEKPVHAFRAEFQAFLNH